MEANCREGAGSDGMDQLEQRRGVGCGPDWVFDILYVNDISRIPKTCIQILSTC